MADLDRIARLVADAMDHFDDSGVTLASLVRRCFRIASLRGDVPNMSWLETEGRDMSITVEGEPLRSFVYRMAEQLPPADRRIAHQKFEVYLARRSRPENDNIYGGSIEQAEVALATLKKEEEISSRIPDGMHFQDLGLRLIKIDKERVVYVEAKGAYNKLLAATRSALWDFLVETEYELTFGEASAETFDRLRQYVDQQLTLISPSALGQFQSAYRRLKEGDAEARAQALTTCRRVLKTLADELYPPSEPVEVGGKTVLLTDSHFMNRLLQFVSQSVGKHGNGAAVQAAILDVDRRLKPLNELASKGVHDDVQDYEVDTCVVQTYLVVADVLRIRERTTSATN